MLTLDYAKKMAQQIIHNEHKRGNILVGDPEDLARHILAAEYKDEDDDAWQWFDKDKRKELDINTTFIWDQTSQGRYFWKNLHPWMPTGEEIEIPPFVK